MESPHLAIAVVSWNTRSLLAACLRSLQPHAERGDTLVVVVDNGSTDGSPELVEREFPWARLIRPQDNLGFGGAVNLAARTTGAEWLAAANADVVVGDGALETLLSLGRRRPEVGALAPRLELPSGETQLSWFRFPALHRQALAAAGGHRLSSRVAAHLGFRAPDDLEGERDVDYAMGAFLVFRRWAFDEVGGFDPDQWMYAEDMDICWRLRRAGWSTVLVPSATVRHVGGAATDDAFAHRAAMLRLAAHYAWLERRRGRAVMRGYAAANLLGALARLALLRPLAAVAPRRWARARLAVADWAAMNRAALAQRGETLRPARH